MNYVYIMSSPHRLSKSQEMRFTRHLWGCPEAEYGIPFEPTEEDLAEIKFTDCTCVTGAPGSPVLAADYGDHPAPQPPLVPPERQDGPRGGQDDEPPAPPAPAPTGWRAALLSYQGTFEFLVNMKAQAQKPSWTPTDKQLASINKCLVREGQPPQQEESVAEGPDIRPLRDLRYAVEQNDGNFYALVLSTGSDKWNGWRFVMGKRLPDGEIERLGRQKPNETYTGGHKADLVTCLAETEMCLDNYYEQTGVCPVCFKAHEPPRCEG